MGVVGLTLEAPKNKTRKNEKYTVSYDRFFIYNEQQIRDREQDIRINNTEDLTINGASTSLYKKDKKMVDIVSKHQTIKPVVKKLLSITNNKLERWEIPKWKEIKRKTEPKWKKIKRTEWVKEKEYKVIYKSSSIKREIRLKNDIPDLTYAEMTKRDIFKHLYGQHFIRFRPTKTINDEHRCQYESRRETKPKTTKCMIEEDDDKAIVELSIEVSKLLDCGVEDY
jgi:hypothetical protein